MLLLSYLNVQNHRTSHSRQYQTGLHQGPTGQTRKINQPQRATTTEKNRPISWQAQQGEGHIQRISRPLQRRTQRVWGEAQKHNSRHDGRQQQIKGN